MLTSTWELEPDDADAGGGAGGAGWSLVVTLKALPDGTQAKTERYRLGPDTVVVPKSNVHHMDIADGAIMTDDTLVVGRLSAVRKYVALFDRLREGAYNLTGGGVFEHATGMTIPLTQYPEGLLLYHMQQEGLDVQRTFFRSELLQLVRSCAPWDEEVQEGDSAASVSAAAMTARVHAEGRYCPQGLVPPPATAANRTADVGANTAAATGVPEGFTPTATCQTECHTYAGDWTVKCKWKDRVNCDGCKECFWRAGGSDSCEANCYTSVVQDWKEKCKWNDRMHCIGCAECGPNASNTQQPQPQQQAHNLSETCQAECYTNTLIWGVKCGWSKTCAGCDECGGASTGTAANTPASNATESNATSAGDAANA